MGREMNQNNMMMCNMMMCSYSFMMMKKTMVSFCTSYPPEAS